MALGFFRAEEFISIAQPGRRSSGQPLGCASCGLDKKCKSPQMGVTGDGRTGCLIIAEAQGGTEDEQGKQLVGQAGQLLRGKMASLGMDLALDFWKINSVQCRPTQPGKKPGDVVNRTPTDFEIACCRPRLMETIERLNPRMILLMGGTALDAFYLGRDVKDDEKIGINSWRAHCIPDKPTGSWVIPLFHPSFLLQNKDPNLESVFDRDLKWSMSMVRMKTKPPTFFDPLEKVVLLKSVSEVEDALQHVLDIEPEFFMHDYETSGLKPYFPGHKIHCASFCYNPDTAYVFPLQYGRPGPGTPVSGYWKDLSHYQRITGLWRRVLENERIGKASHNAKIEDKWSRNILGVYTRNWVWCSMINQHILRSSSGTGLKLQAFLRYGIENYDGDVSKYLKAENSNAFNRAHEVHLDTLLRYCGADSLVAYRLMMDQMREFAMPRNRSMNQCRELFHEGWQLFSDMEDEGIPVDGQYYRDVDQKLEKDIAAIQKKLDDSEEAETFRSRTGRKMDWNSSKDLGQLFYEFLKCEVKKRTGKTNAPSTDKEAIEKLGYPIVKDLVELRQLTKVKSTYLGQFKREIHNNRMHPVFNLHLVDTGRSSCDSPNFQNIPVREETAKKYCRSGIVPGDPDYELWGVDYGQQEVRVMACLTKDPVLIRYIEDPDTDMHRDAAMDMFLMSAQQIADYKKRYGYNLRHIGKNGFVFPALYGSYWKKISPAVWEDISGWKEVLAWLASKGIGSYEQFEHHMQGVEYKFWNRLNITKNWRDNIIQEQYRRDGYTDSFFGFRRDGYMRKNQVSNAPDQGPAFHCLLLALIEINKIRKRENWKTKIVGQIHDEGLFRVHKSEKEYVEQVIRHVMTEKIRERCPWLIVPLDVEVKRYEGSWYMQAED